ncbi:aminoacyl-tRNA hydrolase [Mariniphaga sediminis]|jgi:ribosome-associated protein|uniref:Aminoacyl-tRNA hydrolase n=1 Tax=Mariniphaga sediminis TaxID=1628158 RepID=A0A399CZY6_9BACT|nr:alternative ribosome rescue aminoacyl-tRNA hydrolase ArfB [Mariniphaga sediminis]RIH64062.1 aminoacyl-tRNA hydrolase [Mariniphaga sediminis]
MILSDSKKEKLLTEVQVSASRSSGPGGQNVNKVNTKIELRFPVSKSEVLNETEKRLILSKLNSRINLQGELLITASSERSQWQNREQATQKFFELIEKALTRPRKRKKTQPTIASRLKRLESKKKRGQKKQLRKPPDL